MRFLEYIREVKKALARGRRIVKMSSEELLSLHDEDLYNAIDIRLSYEIRWEKNSENYAGCYDGAKRVFYVISQYIQEVMNGGLCQYFVNSSRLAAPYLLDNLNKLGVPEHVKLLSDFLTENHIDVNDLDSFVIQDPAEFQKKNKIYPFDQFDDAFYKLNETISLEDHLITYVRQHIEEFR